MKKVQQMLVLKRNRKKDMHRILHINSDLFFLSIYSQTDKPLVTLL